MMSPWGNRPGDHSLRQLAAFLAFATNHEDGVVFLRRSRVDAADELAGGDFHFQLSRELEAAPLLRFATAVGYENIRSAMEEVS